MRKLPARYEYRTLFLMLPLKPGEIREMDDLCTQSSLKRKELVQYLIRRGLNEIRENNELLVPEAKGKESRILTPDDNGEDNDTNTEQ